MTVDETTYERIPGLYRLWDLQFLFDRTSDYLVRYAEPTEDGTPLFAVYRHQIAGEMLQ